MSRTKVKEKEVAPPIGLESQQVLVSIKDVKVNAHILRVWIHRHVPNSTEVTVQNYDAETLAVDCPNILLAARVEGLVDVIKTKGTPNS